MVKFPETFSNPIGNANNQWGITQNLTWEINTNNLTAVAVAYIPKYSHAQMHMTEGIGAGIIMSIVTAQLCQQFLKRTVGQGTTWLATCAANSFVYTITTVMMGTASAIFNPAVLFGWAILGRVTWSHWITLSLTQLGGAIAGVVCAWSQFTQQLNRVPIPRKDKDGNWLYMQLRFRKAFAFGFRAGGKVWGPADEPRYKSRPIPRWMGGAVWSGSEYESHDLVPVSEGGPLAKQDGLGAGDAEEQGGAGKLAAAGGEASLDAVAQEWLAAGWTAEEARLAASEEFQTELRLDRKAKLCCFAETPFFYSPFWIQQIWPHFMAGTTLVHWLSFMTGNATQTTNTNVYLTQPVNGPGSAYAFLNVVLMAWLVGLAYFLLSATAGGVCTLQLNPAADLSGRIMHFLLPIPNKGHSGWTYSWVPLLGPFFGATFATVIMYMGMWSHLYFPYAPYGNMRSWW